VNVEATLWVFAAFLSFGVANLLIAAIVLRRRERTLAPAAPVQVRLNIGQILDVLALSLILVVLMTALILDLRLALPSAPAIGRLALFVIGALIIRVAGRLFALLPNTPRWLPRVLRVFEITLLVLGVVGLLLSALRPTTP
jgi:hypothetical protein